jgi:lysophospholipase L1-like esterase
MRSLKLLPVLLLLVLAGFRDDHLSRSNPTQKSLNTDTLSYLALGDSYTIGRLVQPEDSYPYQLCAKLKSKGFTISAPTLIAQNGWRTDELIKGIANSGVSQKFDMVTLLIGVNNQFQGYSMAVYRTEFAQLVHTAIAFAKGNPKHVFVLSIPDWGVTPFAFTRNPPKITAEIDQYNEINKDESLKAGVNYIDITGISRSMSDDLSFLASDHLHPSGKMYTLWTDRLFRAVVRQIR